MSGRDGNLETRFAWLSAAVVAIFSATFGLGLILYVAEPAGRLAALALNAGLVLLMSAPAVRVAVALAERLRTRDWTFVAIVAVVFAELAVVLWRAASRS